MRHARVQLVLVDGRTVGGLISHVFVTIEAQVRLGNDERIALLEGMNAQRVRRRRAQMSHLESVDCRLELHLAFFGKLFRLRSGIHQYVFNVLTGRTQEREAVELELMRVRHQIDTASLVLRDHREQTSVERLLWQKRVAEVLLTRHDVHINKLAGTVQKLVKLGHCICDARVHLLVQLGRAVAAAQHLIDLVGLDSRVTGNNQSLNLGGKNSCVERLATDLNETAKLTTQELEDVFGVALGRHAEAKTRHERNKLALIGRAHDLLVVEASCRFVVQLTVAWDARVERNTREAVLVNFEVAAVNGLTLQSQYGTTDKLVYLELFAVLDGDATGAILEHARVSHFGSFFLLLVRGSGG